jgi:drug/metabolite transporter (DMT)-like permease
LVKTESNNTSFIAVLMSSVFFGTVTTFVALANDHGVGLITQLVMRLTLAIPFVVLTAGALNGGQSLVIQRRDIPTFLGGGLLIFLLFSTYMAAVVIGTPIVAVVFLSNTSAIWSLVLGRVILREEITRRKLWSLLGIMVGILFLSAPWAAHFTVSTGEGLALINGFLFAPYLILVRKKTASYEPLTLTAGFFGAAALMLIAFVPIITPFCGCGGVALNLDGDQWLLMLGLALVGTTIPFVFLNTGLKHIQASVAGILNLANPVVATILSVAVLGQVVEVNQIIGGVLIMLSIMNLRR